MQIYLSIQEDRQGPFTPEEITAKLQSGECTPETLAWKEGLEAWQPLRDVLPQSEAVQPPPLPVAPPSLPSVPASAQAVPTKGGDAFSIFIEGFKGLPGRIGSSPKPQPLKWYDRFPVVFGALALFWPLGIVCVWLTKRFESADKLRLTLIGLAWGFVLFLNSSSTNASASATSTAGEPNASVPSKNADAPASTEKKPVPYYRAAKELFTSKEMRESIFAQNHDKWLSAAEKLFNEGKAVNALTILAPFSDVLPDKKSQDLYERIRKARQEEASALLQKADDAGRGNDPQLVSLLEELDFLVTPSMWYRERLDALKKRTEKAEQTKRLVSSGNQLEQGQTFRLGKYSYNIGRCFYKNSIGPSGFETFPAGKAVFFVVHYSILNETQETQTVASDDFKLRDAKGRVFSPSSRALTALIMRGANKDFILSELQPGVEHQTMTAFEIPPDATVGGLILIVPEKGLMSSGKAEVVLNDIDG